MCNGNAALAAYMIVTQIPYTFYPCDFYKDDLMKMISEGCKSLLFLNVSYTSITDGSCRLIAKWVTKPQDDTITEPLVLLILSAIKIRNLYKVLNEQKAAKLQ